MLKKRLKERFPVRKNPGDPEPEYCTPGSIEQQLDMCEEGSLRGDEILHRHGLPVDDLPDVPAVDVLLDRYQLDSAEENREGSELSGDEHSAGLQGGEPELAGQLHINTGLPGDRTKHEELIERKDWSEEEELTQGIAKRMRDRTA